MDLLEHDHEVLGSQVRHVTALLNGLLSQTFAATTLRVEFLRETKLLCDQVLAHFHLEENGAFPQLAKLVPDRASGLDALTAAHRRISEALSELQTLADQSTPESFDHNLNRIVEVYERFHVAFLVHVQEESDLLRRIGARLTPEQRAEVRRQIESD